MFFNISSISKHTTCYQYFTPVLRNCLFLNNY
jgi:hypothetical protein